MEDSIHKERKNYIKRVLMGARKEAANLILGIIIIFSLGFIMFLGSYSLRTHTQGVLLAEFKDAANNINTLKFQLLWKDKLSGSLFAEIRTEQSNAQAIINKVIQMDQGNEDLKQISYNYSRYVGFINYVLQILAAENVKEAKALDERSLQPLFEELKKDIEQHNRNFAKEADFTFKLAGVGYVLTVITSFLVIGLVFSHLGKEKNKAVIASLQQSELNYIFNSSVEAMRVIDLDFKHVKVNKTFLNLFGQGTGNLCGEKCFNTFSANCNTPDCSMRRILGGEKRVEHYIEKIMPDNSNKSYIITAVPHIDPDGKLIGVVESIRDITDYKMTQNLLNKYKLLADHASDIILFFADDGDIIEANSAAVKAYGYNKDELLKLKIFHLRAAETWLLTKKQMQQADTEGILFEAVHIRKDGSRFPVEINSKGFDLNGKRVTLSIIRDISERKQGEEELKEQKEFSDNLVQKTIIPTFVLDPQHKVISWNDACEKLTGIEKNRVINTDNHWQAFYSHKLPCLSDIIINGTTANISPNYNLFSNSEAVSSGLHAEGWFENLGGEKRHVLIDAAPIYDSKGKLVAVIETIRDNTRQQNAEKTLIESERMFRATFEQVGVGIVHVNTQGQWIRFNNKFCEIVGYEPAEVMQKTWYDVAHHDDVPAQHLLNLEILANKLNYYSIEQRYIHKGGSVRWGQLTVSAVRKRSGELEYLIGVIEEITERKLSENALLQHSNLMKKELEMASKTQRELLPGLFPTRGVNFAYEFKPCVYIAGDMLNVFPAGKRHIGFYILDVKGHGIQAALRAVTLSYILRNSSKSSTTYFEADAGILMPSVILKNLNERFSNTGEYINFFTIFYGVLNIETLVLTYARGGHCAPLIIHPDKDIRELGEGGPAIGLIEKVDYRDYEVQLQYGDKIILYTDGLVEAKDINKVHPEDDLKDFLGRNRNLPIEQLIRETAEDIPCLLGNINPQDDITVLGFQILEE